MHVVGPMDRHPQHLTPCDSQRRRGGPRRSGPLLQGRQVREALGQDLLQRRNRRRWASLRVQL